MQTIQVNLYKYNELSDSAKESAREWYREINGNDSFWSESVIEDSKAIGKIFGFDIDKIYFSGFSNQGDGACFVGSFSGSNFKNTIKEYAPLDTELHAIGNQLNQIIQKYPVLNCKITHSGHYYHRFYADFDLYAYDNENNEIDIEAQDSKHFIDLAREFMLWIYKQLEKEYDYQNSDEAVVESIIANDYQFYEDGSKY